MITAGWNYLHGDSNVDVGSVSDIICYIGDGYGDKVNRHTTWLSRSSVLENGQK